MFTECIARLPAIVQFDRSASLALNNCEFSICTRVLLAHLHSIIRKSGKRQETHTEFYSKHGVKIPQMVQRNGL